MRHLLIFSLAFVAACASRPPAQQAPAPKPRPAIGAHGFALTQLDRFTSPCEDFYQYAVGRWRTANPLPATFARYGRFDELSERNRATLREILETAARSEVEGDTRKLGNFWEACIDEAAAESRGVAPVLPDLERISAISTRAGVTAEIRRQQQAGLTPLFRLAAQSDYRDSRMVIAAIQQGGLGLPDREYYLRDDERFEQIRSAYVSHISRLFELAGAASATARADAERVVDLETRLARASMSRADQRRPENVYHITPISELQTIAPALEWRAFFESVGLSDLRSVNLAQPEFIREAGQLLAELPVETWRAYLRWNILDAAAPLLSSDFVNQDFEFRGRTLSGQQQVQPRWQRCVRAADQHLGDLLGQEYIRRTFTPEAKQQLDDLIDNLVAVLRDDIPRLSWMGAETQAAALQKLEAFRRRIGHPDRWTDYATLPIAKDAHLANVEAARAFSVRQRVARIGKPDDSNEWGSFTPSTVNASYSLTRNDITFPAGILQPPFYDPNADPAYNYGGIGMVIGHEMTHGFDDQGAKFDADGNLRNWWSERDLASFQERAGCISRQYGAWEVEPGLRLQGDLVTGEAIADLGGATLALRAYLRSLEGQPRVVLDGFTPEQRFFLGFAQIWAQNMSPEEARRRALTDPHAPGHARINLTLQNMPEFADAWNCPVETTMALTEAERCGVW
jgi:putative endopeptidase